MAQPPALNTFVKLLMSAGLYAGLSSNHAHAQGLNQIQTQELRRAADRANAVQKLQPPAPEIRGAAQGENPSGATANQFPINEIPCFHLNQISLVGESAGQFQFALRSALKQAKLHPINTPSGQTVLVTDAQFQNSAGSLQTGVCLGGNGVSAFMTLVQNAIIQRGYTTTRVLAQSQDLKSGRLELTVIPGRIRQIRFEQGNPNGMPIERAHSFNAMPMREGDILNLREIEQGLENFKRVPTVEADIQIAPAEQPNESDLVITWAQKAIPLRANLTLDDSGSRSTGKWQGGGTVSIDNPFTLNDLLYFSYGEDVQGHDKVQTINDNGANTGTQHGNTRNWSLHYSVPYGNWQAAFNASSYDYDQAVAGAYQTYTYSGHSRTQDLKLSKMLYRNAQRKLTASIKGWTRYSDNYIDDTEITIQRRKTAGFELGLNHKEYIGKATLDLGITYKRGTGAQKALRAPEELFNEGTSRMRIISADVGLNVPFQALKRHFTYNTSVHAQWNKSRLLAQDLISIGGRNTVRGFDGTMSLAAERGWYMRNELGMALGAAHQLYVAVDAGHVSGNSAQYLLGQTLIGSALGVRGQAKLGGTFNYDVFVGKPLKKPQGFRTSQYTYGVNLGYSF